MLMHIPCFLAVALIIIDQEINLLSIYTPEENKTQGHRKPFFNLLQHTIDELPHDQPLTIVIDIKANTGNQVVSGVKQIFDEELPNDNGESLINMRF